MLLWLRKAEGSAGLAEPMTQSSPASGRMRGVEPLRPASVDHLVGLDQQGVRHLDPKCLCRPQIDDQFELRGLLNW